QFPYDPPGLPFQKFMRTPGHDIHNGSIGTHNEHYGHPALNVLVKGFFGIAERIDDMLLQLLLETGFLVLCVLTARGYGYLVDHGKGNRKLLCGSWLLVRDTMDGNPIVSGVIDLDALAISLFRR